MPSSEILQIMIFHYFDVMFVLLATNKISSTVQALRGRSNEEMGGTCDKYGGEQECAQGFVGEA